MKRPAFTLIELLVVIVIIAMLLGITLPVLSTIRQKARATICGSNIKQLSLSLILYDQKNGTCPHGFNDDSVSVSIEPVGGYAGDSTRDFIGWWWFNFLADTLVTKPDKKNVLWCPSRCVKESSEKPNILCGNYGVNRTICKNAQSISTEFVGRPLSLTQIVHPAQTLLIVDSGYSLISWRGTTDFPGLIFENTRRTGSFYVPGMEINKARTFLPAHYQDAITGRHPKKSVNVGFADGHVNQVTADDLLVKQIGEELDNLSPLWLPK